MNVERLTELHKLLSSIPESHFDLGVWLEGFDGEGKLTHELLGECGSSGCAVGWSCTHKPFVEQGLGYQENSFGVYLPSYQGFFGMDAVRSFFDISEDIAKSLFYTDYYQDKFQGYDEDDNEIWDIKPRDVALRIETLLNNPNVTFEELIELFGKVESK